jgi:serine-type D-Ala-D-Ala carboxypeptidase (penicillin-binding protein 5/6)
MYRRRRVTVAAIAVLLLGVLVYLPMTLLAPLHAVEAQADELPAPAASAEPALDFPAYGASAIGLADDPRMLGTAGTEDTIPMASISKLVTTLVVLDAHPLAEGENGPEVEMTAADVADYQRFRAMGGSVVEVREGWRFTQRDLISLTVIRSGNNYATALVNWAFGGDDDAFRAAARAWLDENGLDRTTLVEPTGLSDENRSTATQVVQLGRLALADPLLEPLVDVRSITVPYLGELPATNRMLGELGIDGIKTGTLYDIVNLLFSSTFVVGGQEIRVVGAILGAPGPARDILNDDVRGLLASTQAGFVEVPLAEAGQRYGGYETAWGQSSAAVAAESASAVAWASDEVAAAVALEPTGVAARGSRVGTATFTVGDETIEVPIELASAITDPGAGWRLANPFALLG